MVDCMEIMINVIVVFLTRHGSDVHEPRRDA